MGKKGTQVSPGFHTPQLIIDQELELLVIGGCLSSTRLAKMAAETLTEEDFPTPRCQTLFGLICAAAAKAGDSASDRALKINCCEPHKREKQQLVLKTMDAYSREAPTGSAFAACMARLHLQAVQRKAALAAWKLVCDACRPQGSVDDFAAYAAEIVEELEAVVSDLRA